MLAKRMTELRREESVETKGFINWLESWTDSKVSEWKQKSKVYEFSQRSVGGLLEVLKANERGISIQPQSRKVWERLESEF